MVSQESKPSLPDRWGQLKVTGLICGEGLGPGLGPLPPALDTKCPAPVRGALGPGPGLCSQDTGMLCAQKARPVCLKPEKRSSARRFPRAPAPGR